MLRVDSYIKKERKGLFKKITEVDYRIQIRNLLTQPDIEKLAVNCYAKISAIPTRVSDLSLVTPTYFVFEIEINTDDDLKKAKEFMNYFFRIRNSKLNSIIKESKYFIIDIHTEDANDLDMIALFEEGINDEVKFAFGNSFEFIVFKNNKRWGEMDKS